MPLMIEDLLKKLGDSAQAKQFFDSAFEKGYSRNLKVLRQFLIELLFANRAECLTVADNKAFVFTCLKLQHNLDIEGIYEMMAEEPKYLIGLGHRDRVIFDAFLENPTDVSLGKLTAGEKLRIKDLEEELAIRGKKFKRGRSKTEYWSLSQGNAWTKQMKAKIWTDFLISYLAVAPKFEPYAQTRELLSLCLDGNICFVCTQKLSGTEGTDKFYVSQTKVPLRRLPAKHPKAVGICYRCFIFCNENQITPLDEVSLQNQTLDRIKRGHYPS